MIDYISRDAALAFQDELEPVMCFPCHGDKDADIYSATKDADLVSFLQSIPAADVAPVVRAHWYWDKDGMDWNIGAWRCSACKAMSPMWWNTDRGSPMHKSVHKYCPNCGARMDGESDV